jgi:hypothetical protein
VSEPISGTLLPEPCLLSLCNRPWQSQQIVRTATEDEEPVHFLQSAQLDLSRGLVCFSHPKMSRSGHARWREHRRSPREIRVALLEADVNVVRDLIEQIRVKAVGTEVLTALSPSGQVITFLSTID